MTLADFKNRVKSFTILMFVIALTIGSFYLGRFTSPGLISKNVKGVSTAKSVRNLIEKPQPYSDEQKAEVISSSVKICSNATFGFEIAYPRDWFSTQNSDFQKCTFFAPFAFVVPQLTDSDFVPITVQIAKPESWQSTVSLYSEPNDFQNIDSVQSIEINGKSATKVDSFSTGKNQIPRGFLKESYLIFDSKTPLIISYIQLNQSDKIEDFKSVLVGMAQSVKLF